MNYGFQQGYGQISQMPQSPYAPPIRNYAPEPPALRTEIIRVNGENGAKALRLVPNCEALLLDTTAPIVWLVQTDGAGYKTEIPFSITPYQAKPPVDVNSLENRIKRLEDMIYESHNAASGTADAPTPSE